MKSKRTILTAATLSAFLSFGSAAIGQCGGGSSGKPETGKKPVHHTSRKGHKGGKKGHKGGKKSKKSSSGRTTPPPK